VGVVCFTLVVAGATALGCGKTIDSGELSGERDASPDVSVATDAPPDAGACCAPGGLGCCMDYGGWSPAERPCGLSTCDGMPVPSDPAWKIEPDSHGCPHWVNPHDYFRDGTRSNDVTYCGPYQPSHDAVDGGDAGDAAAADGRD
jgi:hypothetical protein